MTYWSEDSQHTLSQNHNCSKTRIRMNKLRLLLVVVALSNLVCLGYFQEAEKSIHRFTRVIIFINSRRKKIASVHTKLPHTLRRPLGVDKIMIGMSFAPFGKRDLKFQF